MNAKQIADAAFEHDLDALIGMLTEQRDLYVQLKSHAQNQREMITGDEPERLLSVLAERQRILDRLMSLSEEIRPYQECWDRVRQTMTADQNRHVTRLVREVNTILSEILQQDEKDTQLLASRKSTIAREVGAVRTGRQVGAAYQLAGSTAPARTEWTDG